MRPAYEVPGVLLNYDIQLFCGTAPLGLVIRSEVMLGICPLPPHLLGTLTTSGHVLAPDWLVSLLSDPSSD
jgi:hypothetical protein